MFEKSMVTPCIGGTEKPAIVLVPNKASVEEIQRFILTDPSITAPLTQKYALKVVQFDNEGPTSISTWLRTDSVDKALRYDRIDDETEALAVYADVAELIEDGDDYYVRNTQQVTWLDATGRCVKFEVQNGIVRTSENVVGTLPTAMGDALGVYPRVSDVLKTWIYLQVLIDGLIWEPCQENYDLLSTEISWLRDDGAVEHLAEAFDEWVASTIEGASDSIDQVASVLLQSLPFRGPQQIQHEAKEIFGPNEIEDWMWQAIS